MSEEEIRQQENKWKGFIQKSLNENYGLILPHMKSVFELSSSSLELSSTEEDTKDSFDFTYTQSTINKLNVSCRIRDNQYLINHCDVTIRVKNIGNGLSELGKIKNGDCKSDCYFYAFKNEDGTEIIEWALITLSSIKKYLDSRDEWIGTRINDGSSFIGIPFNELDIIAFHGPTIEWMSTPF